MNDNTNNALTFNSNTDFNALVESDPAITRELAAKALKACKVSVVADLAREHSFEGDVDDNGKRAKKAVLVERCLTYFDMARADLQCNELTEQLSTVHESAGARYSAEDGTFTLTLDGNHFEGYDSYAAVHAAVHAAVPTPLAALELSAEEVGVQGFDDPDFEPVPEPVVVVDKFASKVAAAKSATKKVAHKTAREKLGGMRRSTAVYTLIFKHIGREGGASLNELISAYSVLQTGLGRTLGGRDSLVSSITTRMSDLTGMAEALLPMLGYEGATIDCEGKGDDRRYTLIFGDEMVLVPVEDDHSNDDSEGNDDDDSIDYTANALIALLPLS